MQKDVTLASIQTAFSPPGSELLTQFSCNQLITLDFNIPSTSAEIPTEHTFVNSGTQPQNVHTSSSENFNILHNINDFLNVNPDEVPITTAPGNFIVQADFQTFNYVYAFVLDSGYFPPDPQIIQNMVGDYMRGEHLSSILNRYKQWLTRR